jgi:hypothetical protein
MFAICRKNKDTTEVMQNKKNMYLSVQHHLPTNEMTPSKKLLNCVDRQTLSNIY